MNGKVYDRPNSKQNYVKTNFFINILLILFRFFNIHQSDSSDLIPYKGGYTHKERYNG